jgi:DNA-binding response OmpR family regulator
MQNPIESLSARRNAAILQARGELRGGGEPAIKTADLLRVYLNSQVQSGRTPLDIMLRLKKEIEQISEETGIDYPFALRQVVLPAATNFDLSEPLRWREFYSNPAEEWASIHEVKTDLTPSEGKMVHLLVAHKGKTVKTGLISSFLESVSGAEAVWVFTRRVRLKLGVPTPDSHISTVNGVGLRLVSCEA